MGQPNNSQKNVFREIVVNLCDEYAKMPSTEQEWISKIKSFIENYEFRVLELRTIFMFMYA